MHLTAYTVTDSGVIGRGSRRSHELIEPFDGSIPFSDMVYIETESIAGFRTILAVGAVAFVAGSVISIVTESAASGFTVQDQTHLFDPRHVPSSGGHSCPTLYSWNGSAYSLEGEAFGVAWGKALEMTTCTLLPSLIPDKGLLLVQVRNERPETHYHNQLTLLSAEVPRRTLAVQWTRKTDSSPSHGRCGQSLHVRRRALQSGLRWQIVMACIGSHHSPARTRVVHSGMSSICGSCLCRMRGKGTLAVSAINTDIFSAVLSQVSAVLGDATLEFIHALENDHEVIRQMQSWQEECALRVMVRSGDHWREAGRILPEANTVPFTRAVPLNLSGIGDTVDIRLECLADVWRIDAVCAGSHTTVDHTVEQGARNDVSQQAPGRTSLHSSRSRDERRIAVLPSQTIDIISPALPARLKTARVYALEATGYLHEWMPSRRNTPDPLFLASGSDRITYLKMLLATSQHTSPGHL